MGSTPWHKPRSNILATRPTSANTQALAKLSLATLEVFEVTARTGSLQVTARDVGLSISAVSHHLTRLETDLDVTLFDRSQRPMPLTAAGRTYLRRVEEALRLLRLARREVALGDLTRVRELRIALVEDFDSVVAPELAVMLAQTMPELELTLMTEPSHRALDFLSRRTIDLAVAGEPLHDTGNLIGDPLVSDPFVLAVPRWCEHPLEDYFAGRIGLPFLRFSATQMIGRLVDAHLQRSKIELPRRYELDSAQSILAMVANGAGWSITTPLCYLRAQRFHEQVALHPLPIPAFQRTIGVFRTLDGDTEVAAALAGALRRLIQQECCAPMVARYPWLAGRFVVTHDALDARSTSISSLGPDRESVADLSLLRGG